MSFLGSRCPRSLLLAFRELHITKLQYFCFLEVYKGLTCFLVATFFYIITSFLYQIFYLAAHYDTQVTICVQRRSREKEKRRGGYKDLRARNRRATRKLHGFYPQDEQPESIQDSDTLTLSYSGLFCVAFCSWKRSKNLVNKYNSVKQTNVL